MVSLLKRRIELLRRDAAQDTVCRTDLDGICKACAIMRAYFESVLVMNILKAVLLKHTAPMVIAAKQAK